MGLLNKLDCLLIGYGLVIESRPFPQIEHLPGQSVALAREGSELSLHKVIGRISRVVALEPGSGSLQAGQTQGANRGVDLLKGLLKGNEVGALSNGRGRGPAGKRLRERPPFVRIVVSEADQGQDGWMSKGGFAKFSVGSSFPSC